MIDDGDCGAIGGMKIGRGNRSIRRKPAPAPLCPPQIPLDHTRARTRAAEVGSQRLIAWAMTRPQDDTQMMNLGGSGMKRSCLNQHVHPEFSWKYWRKSREIQAEEPAKIRTERLPNISPESFFFLLMGWDWVHLVLWPLFGLLYQPQMIDDDDDCRAIGGMRISRGIRFTRRKPAPMPLCPPQIPHDLTWARIRAAAVGSRRLTAWAMAQLSLEGYPRPNNLSYFSSGCIHCRSADSLLCAGKYRLATCE
jgi:hypothetical protein